MKVRLSSSRVQLQKDIRGISLVYHWYMICALEQHGAACNHGLRETCADDMKLAVMIGGHIA